MLMPTRIRRPLRCAVFIAVAFGLFSLAPGPRSASAGIEDWEINEVLVSVGGDDSVRYVELANPVGGCLFGSSRVVVFDAAGVALDSTPIVTQATCFGPNTYVLLATPAAAAAFQVTPDRVMAPQLPQAAAQVCFSASVTRYDCVRWGPIANVVVDFFAAEDVTTAAVPTDSRALSRIDRSHIVAADWRSLEPTPRGPNDGTPWTPPDAGPTVDAGPAPDAAPVSDAAPRPDAAFLPDAGQVADASPQRFLDVDPGGGATCSCSGPAGGGHHGPEASLALVLLGGLLVTRRSWPG